MSNLNRMKILKQYFNPMLKKVDWMLMDEHYDFNIDIARAAYADMLHDKERNRKYFQAIKLAVESVKKQGKVAKVLDIGTGTGLLSMMAAKSGADIITACEAFEPMAKCAKKVIKDNKMENKIKVIGKHSSDLEVGQGKDLNEKANILVTELFDTELIGEGALHAYQHAVKHLVEENCICVPHSATVYAQPVSCDMIDSWNTIKPLSLGNIGTLQVPKQFQECSGFPSIHDLQLGQLKESEYLPLTKPVPVFNIIFNKLESLEFKKKSSLKLQALNEGKCNGVFMWWDLLMATDGQVSLSCGPYWHNQDWEWRDHWMQAIHYLNMPCHIKKGEDFVLESFHDDYCFWFDVKKSQNGSDIPLRPICECRMHLGLNRTCLAMLNDPERSKFFINLLKKHVREESVVLCAGEGSWLPYIAGALGARKVFYIENEVCRSKLAEQLVQVNGLQDRVTLIKKDYEEVTPEDFQGMQIDLIVGEVNFLSSILPWDNFYFWHFCAKLKENGIAKDARILPNMAEIRAVATSFSDLHKIRAPVIEAEGFDLKSFDDLIQSAIEDCDESAEPHNIWEYPSVALTDSFLLASVPMSQFINSDRLCRSRKQQLLHLDRPCNGIVIWVDYKFDEATLPSGPTAVVPGQILEWNKYARPGIHFIKPKAQSKELQWELKFNSKSGSLHVDFKLN